MSREAFGPTLRRRRLREGISLEQISAESKIPVELLAALEANDLSAWPVGIYARAYIRQYACAIGIDPEETVEEFCRWFPEGDRRARRTILEQAAIIGHDSTWRDELPPITQGVDRRGANRTQPPRPEPAPAQSNLAVRLARLRRTLGRA